MGNQLKAVKIKTDSFNLVMFAEAFQKIERQRSKVDSIIMSPSTFANFVKSSDVRMGTNEQVTNRDGVMGQIWGVPIRLDQTLAKGVIVFMPEQFVPSVQLIKQKSVKKKDLFWQLLRKQDEF